MLNQRTYFVFQKTTFADTHLHYQNNIKNDKKLIRGKYLGLFHLLQHADGQKYDTRYYVLRLVDDF